MKNIYKTCLSFLLLIFLVQVCTFLQPLYAQTATKKADDFTVKGFHIDLRIEVMTMDSLKALASRLSHEGINTLIMEWEGTYPYEKHPLIPNRFAYSKKEIPSFIQYCGKLGIDVIPLQQSFGHVEYILRNDRYKDIREDQKDFSQVCPLEVKGDSALFSDLYKELISTHTSNYIHIGGDETYLLGHDEKCRLKAEKEGKSKLYIDYIRMLCEIVIKLGKRPVLWADIALKYPDAIKTLPKGTVFVDWNYGWDMNHFGPHDKLVESGYEIWGAPSLRSSPDSYNLTLWEKHFKNIRDFIPASRKMGYKGMVMTSWSTSGIYSSLFESSNDLMELYAIRHVYPISGFNMLISAYTKALKSFEPLNIEKFIHDYCRINYGLTDQQTNMFWAALKTTPYEIRQGAVIGSALSIQQVADSNQIAVKTLYALKPLRNKREFEHYRLMADIRQFYLDYQLVERKANEPSFDAEKDSNVVQSLASLMSRSKELNARFIDLNKGFLNPSELDAENTLRNFKVFALYNRLSRTK